MENNREFIEKLRTVKGFFGEEEGWELKEFIRKLPSIPYDIVELGSFMGKSTICLAQGLRENQSYKGKTKIVAIDHFEGSFEHQKGRSHEVEELIKYGTTYLSFKNNLKRFEINDCVIPIATDASIVAEFWDRPLTLVFIDAEHTYESVKRDFENWSVHIAVDGFIAIHDVAYVNKKGEPVDKFPGVTNFYREISKDQFEEVFDIGSSLRILRRKY